MVQWVMNLTSIHENEGSIPGLVYGLRVPHRSQMWLGSGVAVVVV